MPREYRIVPSDPPRPAGRAAEFVALDTQGVAELALDFAWKRAAAHPRGVCLGDAEHRVEPGRRDGSPARHCTRAAVRRGHERIGAVVYIQHHAVRAFE